MPTSGKLLAWIEPRSSEEVVAAFVGDAALRARAPATRLCASHDEARQWVEEEGAALGLAIEWMKEPAS